MGRSCFIYPLVEKPVDGNVFLIHKSTCVLGIFRQLITIVIFSDKGYFCIIIVVVDKERVGSYTCE